MATRASSEIRALSRDLRALGPAGVRQATRAVKKAVADTTRDAKIAAPVDTGTLRSSITGSVVQMGPSIVGEVGPTVEYGIYVELGTSTQPGQPYLGPAFDRNEIPFWRALAGIGELQ